MTAPSSHVVERYSGPILVTGSAGFIGRHLVRELCRSGLAVRALVRDPAAARDLAEIGAEPVVGDMLRFDQLPRIVAGISGVFHLAGRLYYPGTPAPEYERLHVEATLALLRACADVRDLQHFVLCSTTGVHGPTGSTPAQEDDPGRPETPYEISKARAEKLASELAAAADLPLAIARPGLVYGPGDEHLLGLFRAIQGGYFRVIGAGTNYFHPIYIDDLVKGLRLLARPRAANGRAFHLVGARAVTLREFSDAIGAAVGRPVPLTHLPRSVALLAGGILELFPVPRRVLPLTRSRVRFMTQNRWYDGRRAQTELGFIPEVTLEDGLAMTTQWYRKTGRL